MFPLLNRLVEVRSSADSLIELPTQEGQQAIEAQSTKTKKRPSPVLRGFGSTVPNGNPRQKHRL